MNRNLLSIIEKIVAENGEDILANPQRLKAFFMDYAKDEPKQERLAFGRCIEIGSYLELRDTHTAEERERKKTMLTDQLHIRTDIDKELCADALDLLEAVIFPPVQSQQESAQLNSQPNMFCNKCGTPVFFCSNCGNSLTNQAMKSKNTPVPADTPELPSNNAIGNASFLFGILVVIFAMIGTPYIRIGDWTTIGPGPFVLLPAIIGIILSAIGIFWSKREKKQIGGAVVGLILNISGLVFSLGFFLGAIWR